MKFYYLSKKKKILSNGIKFGEINVILFNCCGIEKIKVICVFVEMFKMRRVSPEKPDCCFSGLLLWKFLDGNFGLILL